MCNWRNWILPGILATVVLTGLAMFFHAGPVERELSAKAFSALQGTYPWATVELDGRELTLSGNAPDEAAQSTAAALTGKVYGVRTVTDLSTLPPVAAPFAFNAVKGEAGITLTGNVPSDVVRAQIVAAAEVANPGIAVVDEMTLARGAPEGFAALAGFGLSQLGGLTAGEAVLSDTVYSVSGTAADPDAFEVEAGRAKGPLPGAGTLGSADIAPPVLADWFWSANKSDQNTITLNGFATSIAERDAIAERAAALNPGSTISNVMKIASGAPDGFPAIADFALGLLPPLTDGAVSVEAGQLAVTGNAATPETFAAYEQALAAATPGVSVVNTVAPVLATPPVVSPAAPAADGAAVASPFVWSAARPSANLVEISGFAPSRKVADTLLSEARDIFGSATEVVDGLQVAGGAPDGFSDAVTFGLAIADRLEVGAVKLSGNAITIEGETLTDAARGAMLERINARAPTGFAVEMANLSVKPGPLDGGGIGELTLAACQDAFDAILAAGRIRFATGEAIIEEISHGMLDRLAYTAEACPSARVEVSGHTDADGSDEANQALSERRAGAVRDYLVNSGVPSERLDAAGYGETRPVGSNDTDEGKARNRRIEFMIIP